MPPEEKNGKAPRKESSFGTIALLLVIFVMMVAGAVLKLGEGTRYPPRPMPSATEHASPER